MGKRIFIGLFFGMALLFCVSGDESFRGSSPFVRRIAAGEWIIKVNEQELLRLADILPEHGLVLKSPILDNWILVSDPAHEQQRELVRIGYEHIVAMRKLAKDSRFQQVLFNDELRNSQFDDWPDYGGRRRETYSQPAGTSKQKSRLDLPLVYHTNDRLFKDQWNLQAAGIGSLGAVDAQDAWRFSTGKAGSVIAVLDDGFYLGHDDLAGSAICRERYLRGFDFGKLTRVLPKAVHGTGVLGVLGACTNNRVGISAIDWRSEILPVARGTTTSDAILALLWAAGEKPAQARIPLNHKPAQVINLSFAERGAQGDLWREALSTVSKRGVIVVAAKDPSVEIGEPLISVGAVDRNQVPLMNCATETADILAPGDNILSTAAFPNEYQYFSGHSFAAPHVSGVVSLMKSVYPNLNSKSALWMLHATQSKISEICPGEVNASKAVELARNCALGKSDLCVKIGKQFLPNAALLDLSAYVIFTQEGQKSVLVQLMNRGGKASDVTIHSDNPEIVVVPRYLSLAANTSVAVRLSWPVDGTKRHATVTFQSADGDVVNLHVK